MDLTTIIFAVVGLLIGAGAGVLLATTVLRNALTKKSNQLLSEAKEKGEVIKKEKILQAKEKFLQMKRTRKNASCKKLNQKSNNSSSKSTSVMRNSKGRSTN